MNNRIGNILVICILWWFPLLLVLESKAQNNDSYPEIGKPCPEFKIDNLEGGEISLSSLKGKPFILDFWTVGCFACVTSFPDVNDIQRLLRDSLQIIQVGMPYKNRDAHAFYNKFKKKYNLNLLSGIDSVVFKKFVHGPVPFVVWVDKGGIVKAITSIGAITLSNVRKFVNDQRFPFVDYSFNAKVKNNAGQNGDQLFPTSIRQEKVLFGSIFQEWKVGDGEYFVSSFNFDKNKDSIFWIRRFDLRTLYYLAYFENLYNYSQEAYPIPILNIRDSTLFEYRSDKKADRKFNYIYYCPPNELKDRDVYSILRGDLDKAFPYKVDVVVSEVPCLELKIVDAEKLELVLKNPKHDKAKSKWLIEGKENFIRQVPIKSLADYLDDYMPYPLKHMVFDTTNRDDLIDLDIYGDIDSLDNIRRQLATVGLDLVPTRRATKTLSISDK